MVTAVRKDPPPPPPFFHATFHLGPLPVLACLTLGWCKVWGGGRGGAAAAGLGPRAVLPQGQSAQMGAALAGLGEVELVQGC